MESIGNLAGGIAHDFNNLLTVIAGCCDLAAARVSSDPDVAESLEGIRSAAVSASALTRQLLTFSRRQIVRPRLLVLNETVNGFAKVLRRLVEESVHIEYRFAPRLPLVRVDSGQVEQVLLNLVANARDAMPGGGTVIIETGNIVVQPEQRPPETGLPPGAYVVLSVTDTGSGMSPEVRAHLFEPFFTTKPRGRGTGLGLATVYGIVKQSGGHIFVSSAPGKGTAFTVYLPVASSSTEVRPVAEKDRPIDLSGSETILVVEDNAPLRRLNEQVLRRYGYHVLVAADAEQAQRICSEYGGPIHAALLDVVMPGDSGPTLGQWISQTRASTTIIYMSGYAGHAIGRHGVLETEAVFLQKPFTPAQLARAVREALSQESSAGHV
jgi:CheY-like chemotaxis protein